MKYQSVLPPLLIAALVIFAPAIPAGDWSGEVAVGYLTTRGNAETTSLNSKLAFDYTAEQWKNALQAVAVNAGNKQGATAERYFVSDQLDYNLSERNYAFGVLEYEKDLFAGIRQRTSEVAGYGRHILTGPVHLLNAELGAGARQTRTNLTGEKHDEPIGRFSSAYLWKISDTARFGESVKVEGGENNTFSELLTELKLKIAGRLAAVIFYNLRHNTNVPATTEKLDTTAGVTLSYGFGKE